MKPLKREPQFDYVDYHHTNLRATFARVRRRLTQEAEAERQQKVTPITSKKKA